MNIVGEGTSGHFRRLRTLYGVIERVAPDKGTFCSLIVAVYFGESGLAARACRKQA